MKERGPVKVVTWVVGIVLPGFRSAVGQACLRRRGQGWPEATRGGVALAAAAGPAGCADAETGCRCCRCYRRGWVAFARFRGDAGGAGRVRLPVIHSPPRVGGMVRCDGDRVGSIKSAATPPTGGEPVGGGQTQNDLAPGHVRA